MNLDMQHGILEVGAGVRAVVIDLKNMLRARLWDLSEDRERVVEGFEPRLPQPFGSAPGRPPADGLRLQLVNEANGLFIPVEFRAEPEGFRVTVKAGWICEQQSINRRLMSLEVLPDLLATRVGDAGFYLLPDFSGTLVVVHKGDFFCHAVTEVNQGGVNRLYAAFGIRHEPSEPIKQEDKELVVRYTEGREDGYIDLARAYHEYLVGERGVSPLKVRITENPVPAYATHAMRVVFFPWHQAAFAGWERAGRGSDQLRPDGTPARPHAGGGHRTRRHPADRLEPGRSRWRLPAAVPGRTGAWRRARIAPAHRQGQGHGLPDHPARQPDGHVHGRADLRPGGGHASGRRQPDHGRHLGRRPSGQVLPGGLLRPLRPGCDARQRSGLRGHVPVRCPEQSALPLSRPAASGRRGTVCARSVQNDPVLSRAVRRGSAGAGGGLCTAVHRCRHARAFAL